MTEKDTGGDALSRGERGPAGDKGAHGQAGDMGLTGLTGETGHEGIPGEKGERGDTGEQGIEGKSSILAKNVSLSFLALAIAAAVVLAVMTFAIIQNRNLIDDIHDQQAQIDEQRVQNRERFRRADLQLCREIEALKGQNREDARETFRNLDRTLRLLGIEKTAEIEDVALENLNADLNRNAPRRGGCVELPSNG